MKKQANKGPQNNNPYNLNTYRNKKGKSQTPNDFGQKGNYRQLQNPYRNYYSEEEVVPTRRKHLQHEQMDTSTYKKVPKSSRQSTKQQVPKQVQQKNTRQVEKQLPRENQRYSTDNTIKQTPEQRRATIKSNNKLSRKQSIQLKRKKKLQAIRRMLLMIFIGVFISYSGVRLIDFFTYPPISYQTVRHGTIDNTEMLDGVIVRDEVVVATKKQGDIHYVIGEGEKVAKNGDVCFITDDKQIETTLDKMNTLDDSIYNMQDKRSNLSYFQAEIHQLNLEVINDMKSFYYSRYWERTQSIYNMRKELEKVIQNRTSIYMDDQTELTEELQAERLELQNQIKNVHDAYEAVDSGIVSYQIDHFETTLTKQFVDSMTYEQFKNIEKIQQVDRVDITEKEAEDIKREESNKEDSETAEDTQKVDESQELEKEENQVQEPANEEVTNEILSDSYPLYKIITDDKWQLATYLKQEDAVSYEEGKSYNLYFDNHTYQNPIEFRLTKKVEEGKHTKLIFTSNHKLSEFLDTRFVSFSIGKNKASGLKIPLKAVVEKNVMKIPAEYIVTQEHASGVYKVQGENSVFVPVDVQYKGEIEGKEYVYILQQIDNPAGIQLGDNVKGIESQEKYTLNEVETVQGVYSINGSYAKFKPIKIVMTNKEHAILSQGRETVLKEFDQIISNPKNIKEDQLLRYMNIKNE